MGYIIIIFFIILGARVYFNEKELKEHKKDTDSELSYLKCSIERIQKEREKERYKKIKESLPKDFHLYYSYILIGKISYKLDYKGETHIMCGSLDEVENHVNCILSITNKGHTKKHYNKETSKKGSQTIM